MPAWILDAFMVGEPTRTNCVHHLPILPTRHELPRATTWTVKGYLHMSHLSSAQPGKYSLACSVPHIPPRRFEQPLVSLNTYLVAFTTTFKFEAGLTFLDCALFIARGHHGVISPLFFSAFSTFVNPSA
jgi:hypothetical protein